MKCPTCHGESVTEDGPWVWCIGWWPYEDADGAKHRHDPNRRRSVFVCANGHAWERTWFIPCPACGEISGPELVEQIPAMVVP
jgi:hypothetical protein